MRLLVGDGLSFYEGMPGKEYSSLDIYDKNGLRAGRVEMCWNGNFTAVCSEQWDNRDASVVCRQLGFSPYGRTLCKIPIGECASEGYSSWCVFITKPIAFISNTYVKCLYTLHLCRNRFI